jgi:hypothetical protein
MFFGEKSEGKKKVILDEKGFLREKKKKDLF